LYTKHMVRATSFDTLPPYATFATKMSTSSFRP
jgi:hypothetical protein